MAIVIKEIIGNQETVGFIDRLIHLDQLPGALLVTGPAMVGKTTIIEQAVIKLLCEKKNGCGLCASCKNGISNHPDVVRQAPSDEESQRKQIVHLLKRIHEKPLQASKTVVILENIDGFSWAAAPLLLKALEDAPPFVVFFMTADNLDAVLPTIRSRSVVRMAVPLNTESLERALRERQRVMKTDNESLVVSQTGENAVNLITRSALLSGGRPGLAFRLLGDEMLRQRYWGWFEKMQTLSSMSIGERSQLADEIDKLGAGKEILDLLQSMLRDQIVASWQKKDGKRAECSVSLGQIRRSREGLAMLKANVPSRLVMEYIFFVK